MMEMSLFAFLVNIACFTGAGLLTGYMLGKDKGYIEGYRRGAATGKAAAKIER